METSKRIILMLSGGRDSFLTACRLLESPENYHLLMVTFDNGCLFRPDNAELIANRLINKYGADRAEYLGIYKTASIVREFFSPYFNMKPSDQVQKYSGMTPSQFHCLICRTSMYICSIWLAQFHHAHYIAEGSRKDQGFVIELPGMAQKRYPELVQMADMELLMPVYELNDNWERDNELLRRGYLSKSYEPKCLIGFPINGSVDESVIEGVHAYYDHEILRRIKELDLLSPENAAIYLNNPYDELNA